MNQWWTLLETEFAALNDKRQRLLFDSFRKFAYGELLYLLKDHALIEDVIQDSFLKVTSKHKQIKNASCTKQWIRRIIRNTALDALKKINRCCNMADICNIADADTVHLHSITSVVDTVENNVRNQLLHQSIRELKWEYKILIWKYYMEEKPLKIIAKEFEVSEQAITQRLARARKKLFLQFSGKWIERDYR